MLLNAPSCYLLILNLLEILTLENCISWTVDKKIPSGLTSRSIQAQLEELTSGNSQTFIDMISDRIDWVRY